MDHTRYKFRFISIISIFMISLGASSCIDPVAKSGTITFGGQGPGSAPPPAGATAPTAADVNQFLQKLLSDSTADSDITKQITLYMASGGNFSPVPNFINTSGSLELSPTGIKPPCSWCYTYNQYASQGYSVSGTFQFDQNVSPPNGMIASLTMTGGTIKNLTVNTTATPPVFSYNN